jgi:hypothetical protein
MTRNTSNLQWYSENDSPVSLKGNGHLKIDDQWNFELQLNKINVDYVSSVHLINYLDNHYYGYWENHNELPYSLKGSVDPKGRSIYPKFVIDCIKNNIQEQLEFSFRPIIVSQFDPIFDTRLARSNNPADEWKINPILQFLNNYGFDCSTLGREVKARSVKGEALMRSEKEWASGGDCFIAILTERFQTSTHKLPPGWVHAEDGLSFSNGRPRFVFIEKNIKRDGSYRYFEDNHVLEFDPSNINQIKTQAIKLIQFREECAKNRQSTNLNNLGTIALVASAFIGIAATIDSLTKKT